jgi:serine protease Do
MKQLFGYVISGIIGGFICIGFFKLVSVKEVSPGIITNPRLVSETMQNRSPINSSIDFVDAASKSTSAVVHIKCEVSSQQLRNRANRSPLQFGFGDFLGEDFFGMDYYREQSGTGSGVFYSADGYIITNNHVVGFGDEITVTTQSGKKYKAKKVGTDASSDLAVIKIEGNNFPTLKIGNSDALKVGEWVLAVGNPFDYLTSTVTAGIVSAKGRQLGLIKAQKPVEEFIQTDAAVNPGNSGGALVNTQGELVGINTAIATPTGTFAGYSFAIPSNLAKSIINSIIKTGGDYERIDLGILGYDVDDEIAADLKLKLNYGFYIDDVENRSPAKFAGLLPGDVIIALNSTTMKNYHEIETTLKTIPIGDTVVFLVLRDGKEMKIQTKLRKGF